MIAESQHLGYRRTGQRGTWIARYYTPEHGRRFHAIGVADDTVEGDGIQVFSFQQALEAAQKWIAETARADDNGVHLGPYSVAMACQDYMQHRERRLNEADDKKRAAKLHQDQTTINAHILPRLGSLKLSELTHGRLVKWRDALADVAPRVRSKAGKPQAFRELSEDGRRARKATANKILGVLKAVLNYAKSHKKAVATDDAWIDVKPFKGVDKPRVRFLSHDEIETFIPACNDDFAELVKGALLTGCRYGELAAMTAGNFDKKHGTVFVAESKNGEPRYVELNAEAVAFLTHITQGRNTSERIFMQSDGKPWTKNEQQRPMIAACTASKIEGVSFHILRHTYASHAVMNGMPLRIVAKNIGHKDTRITERHYAHLSKSYEQEMIRAHAPKFGFDKQLGPQLVQRSA
ncbi:MAG TPA: tyrosine-type recombinase/integrase [Acidobacteriaceae bacterium]